MQKWIQMAKSADPDQAAPKFAQSQYLSIFTVP